jgi:N-methylhydantoinase B
MRVPMLVESKRLIDGSGGGGRHRGGMGSGMTVRKLDRDGVVNISFQTPGMCVEPPGLLGGAPARRSRALLAEKDAVVDISSDGSSVSLERQAQRFTLEASGGAGYGAADGAAAGSPD